MDLAAWPERNGVARVIAYRWFRVGPLPAPARRVGRLILVGEPIGEAGRRPRTALSARVSSADRKADLDRQVAGWPCGQRICRSGSTESSSRSVPRGGAAPRVRTAVRDSSVHRSVVEHRDGFCRFGSRYVRVGLAGRGRERVLVDAADVDDDFVRDTTVILASMCARLDGKRAPANRARRAVEAAAIVDGAAT